MTLDDLATATGLTPRTIRFYISQGMVPPPGARGRGAQYDSQHLAILRRILELRAQRYRLDEIRDILMSSRHPEVVEEEEVAFGRPADADGDLPRVAEAPVAYGAADMPTSGAGIQDYVRRVWAERDVASGTPVAPRRWVRHPVVEGVELHVAEPVARDEARLIDSVIRELRDELTARRRARGRSRT